MYLHCPIILPESCQYQLDFCVVVFHSQRGLDTSCPIQLSPTIGQLSIISRSTHIFTAYMVEPLLNEQNKLYDSEISTPGSKRPREEILSPIIRSKNSPSKSLIGDFGPRFPQACLFPLFIQGTEQDADYLRHNGKI